MSRVTTHSSYTERMHACCTHSTAAADNVHMNKEHMQGIQNNNRNSGYSNCILNTRHTHTTMTNTMDDIKARRKGKYLNTLEKYHIYAVSKTSYI
jgi:hypothetical protein